MTTAVIEHLRRRISLEGPMTIATFMTEVLFHPHHGSYMRADPIGARGHFITAPEISQMFGEVIGVWCLDLWRRHGAPQPTRVIELGPGRGSLMEDFLRATAKVHAFHDAMTLHMIDLSPCLRTSQHTSLAQTNTQWHTQLDDVEEGFVLIIANEFFDCLPIHQLQRTENGWCERLVDTDSHTHGLCFVVESYPKVLALLVPESLSSAPLGSIVEFSLARQQFLRSVATRIVADGGALLLIDYGYQHPQLGDTLQALHRHQRVSVLSLPGSVDITAHVDFSALMEATHTQGARSYGPVEQRDFLSRLGIVERANVLKHHAHPTQIKNIDTALHRLLDTTEMGSLFKVMAVTASPEIVPAGFMEFKGR